MRSFVFFFFFFLLLCPPVLISLPPVLESHAQLSSQICSWLVWSDVVVYSSVCCCNMGNAPSGKSTDVGMCSQKCFGKKITICQNGQPASQMSLYLSLQCKLSCRRQKLTSRRNGIILTWLELGQNSVGNLNFFFLLLEYNHSDRF